MDFRDMVPWSGRARERLAGSRESLRGFVEPMERLIERTWSQVLPGARGARIEETPKEIVVKVHLPGYKREEIAVEATETSLVLRGGAARAGETRRHGLLSRRQEVRTFTRRFVLPAAVKPEGAAASYKDETLEVRLPRVKEVVARRIEIA